MVAKECQLDLSIPIHSHLWSKYSKIPGLNLFLQELLQLSVWFYQLLFPFQSWWTVAKREWGSFQPSFGSTLKPKPLHSSVNTEPLLRNVQVTDCSRDTKNAWEHSDIWALWHFSLIEWIGKTGVFGQPVIFETLQIFEGVLIAMSGEKGGEGEKRQRSRHSRWGWWWIWYWWWTLKNMINCAVMVMSNNEFIINNMSENS